MEKKINVSLIMGLNGLFFDFKFSFDAASLGVLVSVCDGVFDCPTNKRC